MGIQLFPAAGLVLASSSPLCCPPARWEVLSSPRAESMDSGAFSQQRTRLRLQSGNSGEHQHPAKHKMKLKQTRSTFCVTPTHKYSSDQSLLAFHLAKDKKEKSRSS